jgi:hypothetical protein
METSEELAIFQHPDPDIDEMPDQIPADLELHADIASRIIRAALKAEASAEVLEDRMKSDMAAWASVIGRQQARAQAWRASVKDWMIRNDVKQLKSPWFTASIGKGRTKIVVDDEPACIAALRTLGAEKAVRIKESVVKQEMDSIFNARPLVFQNIAHEETGEPTLLVRKAKE